MVIRRLIGARVREVRTSLELSQAELAERAGLGVETISRLERGVQGVTMDNLYALAQAMNVPFKNVVDIEEDREPLVADAALEEIVDLLRGASKETLLVVHKVVRAIVEGQK